MGVYFNTSCYLCVSLMNVKKEILSQEQLLDWKLHSEHFMPVPAQLQPPGTKNLTWSKPDLTVI